MSLIDEVKRPGDYKGIFNTEEQQILIHFIDKEHNNQSKYVTSNAFKKIQKERAKAVDRPVYDIYGLIYSGCDHFNRNLHDRCFPYRKGGREAWGVAGNQHDFMFSSVLQNVFAAHCAINGLPTDASHFSFKNSCIALSDELFEYAINFYPNLNR